MLPFNALRIAGPCNLVPSSNVFPFLPRAIAISFNCGAACSKVIPRLASISCDVSPMSPRPHGEFRRNQFLTVSPSLSVNAPINSLLPAFIASANTPGSRIAPCAVCSNLSLSRVSLSRIMDSLSRFVADSSLPWDSLKALCAGVSSLAGALNSLDSAKISPLLPTKLFSCSKVRLDKLFPSAKNCVTCLSASVIDANSATPAACNLAAVAL